MITILLRAILSVAILFLAGCGKSRPTLTICTFSDYISPQVLSDFESQFGCKIVLDGLNTGDAMMAKLAGGAGSLYDIIGVGDGEIPAYTAFGLLAPLRHENIPNLKNLDPALSQGSSDPGHAWSTPYSWFTVGLLAKANAGPLDETWGLLFDPAKQKGSFVLVDESRTLIATALCYKGYSVNTTNVQELAEAREILIEAKKRSLGLEVPTALLNRALSGGVDIVIGFNGLLPARGGNDPQLRFFIPREGSYLATDSLAISAKSRQRDLAEKFLNYLLDARVAARNSAALRISTPVKAAMEYLPPEIRNDPNLYPPEEVMNRLEFMKPVSHATRLYDEMWTQIKAK